MVVRLLRIAKLSLCLALSVCFCDRKIDLLLNDGVAQKQINFSCGSAAFSITTMSGHGFAFNQSYDLRKEVSIYYDSLRVFYKGVRLITKLYDEDNDITFSPYIFNGKKELVAIFHIQNGAVKGDTIMILPSGYLYCSSEKISIDTINVIVNRNF